MLRLFAHSIACCWMLLDVVAQSLKQVKLFSQQLPTFLLFSDCRSGSATMLDPFAQLFQHCWGHSRSLRMIYKDLWVVSFPRCTAGPNIVESCCIRLHTAANTHAANPNIAGATLLGVVASVCTQPKQRRRRRQRLRTPHLSAYSTSFNSSNVGKFLWS